MSLAIGMRTALGVERLYMRLSNAAYRWRRVARVHHQLVPAAVVQQPGLVLAEPVHEAGARRRRQLQQLVGEEERGLGQDRVEPDANRPRTHTHHGAGPGAGPRGT